MPTLHGHYVPILKYFFVKRCSYTNFGTLFLIVTMDFCSLTLFIFDFLRSLNLHYVGCNYLPKRATTQQSDWSRKVNKPITANHIIVLFLPHSVVGTCISHIMQAQIQVYFYAVTFVLFLTNFMKAVIVKRKGTAQLGIVFFQTT